MSITSYTLKIKELLDALGLIDVVIDDNEMVQLCLGGLAPQFNTMRTTVLARENTPHSLTSNQYCWLKRITPDKGATRQKVKYSIPNRMIEETLAAEIEVNSDKAVMVGRLKGEIPTNGKRIETVPESSVEGGVIMPDHPGVTTHPNAGIVETMATMKRSARKRRLTRS